MRLVIDTNIIMSALIKEGMTRKLIMSNPLEFLTPEHVFEEIDKHKEYLARKSGMKTEEAQSILRIIKEKTKIIPINTIREKMSEAKKIMREIDENDAPIIACALATKNQGIWTEDKHFKKQNAAKTWTTKELSELFFKNK